MKKYIFILFVIVPLSLCGQSDTTYTSNLIHLPVSFSYDADSVVINDTINIPAIYTNRFRGEYVSTKDNIHTSYFVNHLIIFLNTEIRIYKQFDGTEKEIIESFTVTKPFIYKYIGSELKEVVTNCKSKTGEKYQVQLDVQFRQVKFIGKNINFTYY